LLRNYAADNLVDKFKAGTRRKRIELEHDVSILTASTALANELAFALDVILDRLSIRYLRPADIGFDLEFTQQAVDDDFQVEFAHAGDDRLPCLLIDAHFERRIFLVQSGKRHAELFLVSFGLGLDSNRDDRLREFHRLENDWRI